MNPIERSDAMKRDLGRIGQALNLKDELLRINTEVEQTRSKVSALSKDLRTVREKLHFASSGPEQAAGLRDLAVLVDRKGAMEAKVQRLLRDGTKKLKLLERIAKELSGSQAEAIQSALKDLLGFNPSNN